MLLIENILMALNALRANKMRALLTMLGIIIGIGSVIGIVNVGDSMANGINDSLSGMGISNITLSLEQKDDENTSSGSFFMFGRSNPDKDDLISDEMLSEYKSIYSNYVSCIYMTESVGNNSVELNGNSSSVSLTGISADYAPATRMNIVAGRIFNERDFENGKKVCLISSTLCGELMPMQDPIGQEIEISSGRNIHSLYVVGVYEDSASSATGSAMYIPITTARTVTGSSEGYRSATVVPTADTDTSGFIDETDNYFSQVYSRNKSYTVTASSMESMVESMTEMLSTISLAIAVIAGISLLVGGIGVMNIMLVSITERTREIGTRKALGATNSSIRLQFIIESIVICMLGGLMGIGLGILIGNIGAALLGYSATISASTVLIAVSFSMAIGVFFGYYPANKAAKLDPIEALRYE